MIDAVTLAEDAMAMDKLAADAEVSMDHDELVDAEDADDAMDRDEANTCLLPNSLWTDVAAINSHADAKFEVVKQVHMGSISMTLIDSEGQADKVPRKPARWCLALPS